jgi:3-oxoacyl-[acyl-carrier protein] reductase
MQVDSRGIGAGLVRRLALDGASVAFTYSSSREVALKLADEIQSEGGRALPLKANSASAEELRAAVLEATQMLGPLDIFVSNAGILIRGTIDTYSLEDLDRMIAINIRAAFVGVQAAAHLAPRAITINNVQPGPTATEMRVHLMPKS